MKRLKLSLLSLFLLSATVPAGPLTIGFDSSLLYAQPGRTVTFGATVTNTSAATVFLSGDAVNIAAPLAVNDAKFFLNFPLSLAGGASARAAIFDVSVPQAAAFGVYSGRFDILSSGIGTSGSADFAVTVVPEPASLSLLALGALALLWRVRGWHRIAPYIFVSCGERGS